MKAYITAMTAICLAYTLSVSASPVTDTLLAQYAAEGKGGMSAESGKSLWNEAFASPRSGDQRSCATCHTADLRADGEHKRTGKRIEPMAPSVNSKRLTDRKKIEKWFKRNCKWTLGRECTASEKGSFIMYIESL
ncbi:MAG: DUF1924 domain-containing protein [Sedimenticola sp.]